MAAWRGQSAKEKIKLKETLRALHLEGRTSRMIVLPQLWEDDLSLTVSWRQFQPTGGGQRRWVRCSLPFLSVLESVSAKTHFGVDPVEQLLVLLTACSPSARLVFVGPHSPARLFQMNDCVFEKAFIFAIIALSKCLGPDRFPQGIYGHWPPAAPGSFASSSSSASSSAAPAVIVDAHVPSLAPIALLA